MEASTAADNEIYRGAFICRVRPGRAVLGVNSAGLYGTHDVLQSPGYRKKKEKSRLHTHSVRCLFGTFRSSQVRENSHGVPTSSDLRSAEHARTPRLFRPPVRYIPRTNWRHSHARHTLSREYVK